MAAYNKARMEREAREQAQEAEDCTITAAARRVAKRKKRGVERQAKGPRETG